MEKKVCPYAKECGGCDYQGIPYAEQLKKKEKNVTTLFSGLAEVEPIIAMDDPNHYRAKVQAVFGLDSAGRVASGTYAAHSHRLVSVNNCLLHDKEADAIIASVRKLAISFRMPIYNEDTGTGFLRHVLVRRGRATGQTMVVIVGASHIFPGKKNFARALVNLHPNLTTVIFNINPRRTTMVLGEREETIYGPGTILDTLCGVTFRISARSFFQVNPQGADRLFSKAIELASLKGKERLLDAYCGIGTLGLIAAHTAPGCSVTGVELNADAVRDARANASKSGIRNARFVCADAGEFLLGAAVRQENYDVVFLDPPRSGSTPAFLHALLNLAPKKILYISCDPITQVRDLRTLLPHYRLETVVPIDMFPHTAHVESVVLMSRVQK